MKCLLKTILPETHQMVSKIQSNFVVIVRSLSLDPLTIQYCFVELSKNLQTYLLHLTKQFTFSIPDERKLSNIKCNLVFLTILQNHSYIMSVQKQQYCVEIRVIANANVKWYWLSRDCINIFFYVFGFGRSFICYCASKFLNPLRVLHWFTYHHVCVPMGQAEIMELCLLLLTHLYRFHHTQQYFDIVYTSA